MPRALLAALALVLLTAPVARAQVIGEQPTAPFPDPKKFSRGIFVEGQVGAMIYVGKMGKYADPGPAFALRGGYDLARWFAVELHVGGTTSAARTPDPQTGQTFQLFVYAAEARLQLQVRRVGLFLEYGGGLVHLPTNTLDAVGVTNGKRLTGAVIAGLGIDVHTLNRHFSVGLGADYMWLAQFSSSHIIAINTYIRYTN